MLIHSSNRLMKIISAIFSTIIVALLTSCSPEPEIIEVVVTATPEPAIATVVVTATPEPAIAPRPATTPDSRPVVSNSDEFDAHKELAIAEGKSEFYAEGYATYLSTGGRQEVVDSFAIQYEQQRADGKSHAYAASYASVIAQGKSSEYASIFGQTFATELEAARKEGRLNDEAIMYATSFASAYASVLTLGESEDYAKLFAPAYAEQIMAGKSDEYASAYAYSVAIGAYDAVAAPYAEQIVAGKSFAYATMYGTEYAKIYAQLSQSLSHEDAAEYANIRAKAKSDVYLEQLGSGKFPNEAEDYANTFSSLYEVASLLGNTHEEALEYARANTESESSAQITSSQTSGSGSVPPHSASATPADHQNPTPTSRPVPTSTPATQGYGRSRNQPKPIRTPIDLGNGIAISVEDVTKNANQIIKRYDAWTEPPPSGHQFLIVGLQVANVGDEPIDIYTVNELSLVGSSNVSYDQGFSNECWTFPNELDTSRTLFPTGSLSGNICFTVKSSDVDSLVMYYESISFFGDDEFVYWALR